MKNRGNIKFFPRLKRVRYNTNNIFGSNIIKIPDYVIDEVIAKKYKIDVYYKNKYQRTFSYDNLHGYIKGIETRRYKGVFRKQDINYKLARVEVQKYNTLSQYVGGERRKNGLKEESRIERFRGSKHIRGKIQSISKRYNKW